MHFHLATRMKTLISLFFVLFSFSAFAQTGTIRGQVKDANGQVLVGASVLLEGQRGGTVTDNNGFYNLSSATGIEKFNAVGIGPGIGVHPSHNKLLAGIFEKVNKPMVIDADALNIMAENKELLKLIPAQSIITPHPKEFERLFGKTESDFERLALASTKSKELNIYIVLKGHYGFISTPNGKEFFNSTGNAGMATAGSGDVLTGIITGLLAQGYSPAESSVFGVYLHGLAGDFAAAEFSQEAMLAGDIINCMPAAFKAIGQ